MVTLKDQYPWLFKEPFVFKEMGDSMKMQVPQFNSEAEEAAWWSSHAGLQTIENAFAEKFKEGSGDNKTESTPRKHPIKISTEVDPNYKDEEDDSGETEVHSDSDDDEESP